MSREIELRNRHGVLVGKAIVDADMFEFLNTFIWRKTTNGYAAFGHHVGKKYESVYMHQAVLGKIAGTHIDHINHNTLDNQRANLRIVPVHVNIGNQKRKKCGATGRLGVHKTTSGRYQARIRVQGKEISLGCFATPEDAGKVYMEYRESNKIFFGENQNGHQEKG